MRLGNWLQGKLVWFNSEGININTNEKREYFRGFIPEVLTSKPNNKELIKNFVSKKANNKLEGYIQEEKRAWAEDSDGETRVYLIKDKRGEVALFFSLKCGLLVGEDQTDKLSDDQQMFVDSIVEMMYRDDEASLRNMYDAGESLYGEDIDKLFKIADRRLNLKTESTVIGQSENTINVSNCISAIEFRHFCRNENYHVPEALGVPLGFGLFWEVIVPLVIDVTKLVGCKYLYLFAADQTQKEDKPEMRKLISYYKNTLKFSECDDWIKFVKPEYDNYCYGLVQEIGKLESNREAVWHEFSDV